MWTQEEVAKLWQSNYFDALRVNKNLGLGIVFSLTILLPIIIATKAFHKTWWPWGIVASLYLVYTLILWIFSSMLTTTKARKFSALDKVIVLMSTGYGTLTGLLLVFAMLWLAGLFADVLLINPWLKLVGWSLLLAVPIGVSWARVPLHLRGQGTIFSAKEQAWGLGLSSVSFGLAALVRGTDYEPLLGMALGMLGAIVLLPYMTIKLYQIVILS